MNANPSSWFLAVLGLTRDRRAAVPAAPGLREELDVGTGFARTLHGSWAARSRWYRSPSIVVTFAGGVALLVAAVLTSAGGGSDGFVQTGPVTITGAPLAAYPGPSRPDPAVGDRAPELNGETISAAPVSVANDGRAKMILFVAHWCTPCQRQVPVVRDWLGHAGLPSGIEIYAVSTGVNAKRGNFPPSTWLTEENWPVTTMVDDAGSAAGAAFGLTSYPYFVFVDAGGTVRGRVAGEQPVTALMQAATSLTQG